MTVPCRIYAGTEDGVRSFRFEADRLEPSDRGLEKNAVRAIAVHPRDPRTAYVGCRAVGTLPRGRGSRTRRTEPLPTRSAAQRDCDWKSER